MLRGVGTESAGKKRMTENNKVSPAYGGRARKGRSDSMRTRVLVGVVVALHALALGGILVMQGCGTTRGPAPEPPPAPLMPPRADLPGPVATPPPQGQFSPPAPIAFEDIRPEPSEVRTYTIQSGDSLSRVAAWFGVSARELAELNAIKDPNKIRIGQTLQLPAYAKQGTPPAPTSAPKSVARPVETSSVVAAGGSDYVVVAGDSLSKIASRHGTTVRALKEANRLTGDLIRVGQKLVLPGKEAGTAQAARPVEMVEKPAPQSQAPQSPQTAELGAEASLGGEPISYVVQEGDTLDHIAKMFAISQDDLIKLNNLADPAALRPGMKVKIPVLVP